MKISYAITVCNELEEIKRLLQFLLTKKRTEDEVVVLYDSKNGNKEVLDLLLDYQSTFPDLIVKENGWFINDFAAWKNLLNSYCTGDFIFQLDADEMIDEYMVKSTHEIISLNPDVDLIFVPRINTVEGITQEHINKWGWNVNDKGYVNYPDYQGRIYRKNMSWYGKVHERIIGGQKFSSLPNDNELYCIQHHKTITKQEKQNDLYNKI